MNTCLTRYFDAIEYAPESVIHFPAGLPGFEQERDFVIVEQPAHRPLLFLQSLAKRELCFLMLPVLTVDAEYRLRMRPEDVELIGFRGRRQPRIGRDVFCGVFLTAIPDETPTANLLAPIVINLQTRIAVQAVRPEPAYSHCHPLSTREMVMAC